MNAIYIIHVGKMMILRYSMDEQHAGHFLDITSSTKLIYLDIIFYCFFQDLAFKLLITDFSMGGVYKLSVVQ